MYNMLTTCIPESGRLPRFRQSGLSIIELMVAMTLGLLILAGLSTIFVQNSNTRKEIERANIQTENGRYAMQLFSFEMQNAGYFAEFDPTILASPASKPDPCATALADLKSALPLHVQGYDNGASAPSCVTDLKSGTDIVVLRRVSTCAAGSTDCDAVASGVNYFQASLCNSATELNSLSSSDFYRLDSTAAALDRHKRDCTTLAEKYRYRTDIFFVANNDNSGDGIPTLKRAELGASGFTVVPLVEGIENLQVEYGIDTSAPADGTPDVYTANPDTYGTCAGVECWRAVVAVKLHLLARNTEKSPGHTDSKTYNFGLNADGTNNTASYPDQYKRHMFDSLVKLNNPAGRRAP